GGGRRERADGPAAAAAVVRQGEAGDGRGGDQRRDREPGDHRGHGQHGGERDGRGPRRERAGGGGQDDGGGDEPEAGGQRQPGSGADREAVVAPDGDAQEGGQQRDDPRDRERPGRERHAGRH